jgi:uncharacterized phiE125 gp8 family phage protein
MQPKLVTPPTAEPLSLAEAYQHLRAASAELQDAKIWRAIRAARAACEIRTQNQILAARWQLVLDSFPGQARRRGVVHPLGPVLRPAGERDPAPEGAGAAGGVITYSTWRA